MNTNARTAALAIALTAGLAAASTGYNAPAIKPLDGTRISGLATPVTLTTAQRASILGTFAFSSADTRLLDGVITPSTVFTETIGLKERTDRLNLEVKPLEDMVAQEISDLRAQIINTRATLRAASTADIAAQLDIDYDDIVKRAEQRILDARARIAPGRIEEFTDIDMHTVELPVGVSAETMAEILMRTGDYEYVSIDWLCYPTDTTPNDSSFNQQYYHPANYMDSVGAWDFTTGGSGYAIAVCDSGVDLDHPDLNVLPGHNAVDDLAQTEGGNVNDVNGHGSNVSGAAAALGNNGIGGTGMGWSFDVIPCRVSNNSSGTAFIGDILQGARWGSDNGAYASNCSYGGSQDVSTNSSGNHIRNEGHHLVFSSGNFGLNDQQNDWDNVLIVGASNVNGSFATFSHTGPGVDCVAPGVNVYTTNRFGGYGFVTGTSFSSPIAAGALMLISSANPALSADEVDFILQNSCDDLQATGEDDQTGSGRINVGQGVIDAINGPELLPLPLVEDFSDDDLRKWRDLSGDVMTSSAATNEPSGDDALRMADAASARTVSFRGTELAGTLSQIILYTQTDSVEAGETLTVEYEDIFNNWATLGTITADGSNSDNFAKTRYEVSSLMYHNDFKLRLTTNGNEANDVWFIDDLQVIPFEGNSGNWFTDFESGISTVFDWESSNAALSEDADNEPSGTKSANLDNADAMTSLPVDVTDGFEVGDVLYARFWTQHKGVESGESLLVEYKDLFGFWTTVQTVTSDGSDQTDFDLYQIPLDALALHPNVQIRFTAQGDEANDDWYIDDVALTTEFIEEPAECPADLDASGALDFGDVSTFLTLFATGDLAVDFDDSGSLDFGDVSTFLGLFAAGCP